MLCLAVPSRRGLSLPWILLLLQEVTVQWCSACKTMMKGTRRATRRQPVAMQERLSPQL
jgi:hypothetical protein